MTDPMTTPPIDLTALRADVESSLNTDPRFPGGGYGVYLNTTVLALLDRLEAAERDLAAVTVSRDGWQPRAEAAEKKVAAVREVHKPFEAEEYYNGMDGESLSRVVYECAGCADVGGIRRYPCPTIAALDTHTPETETTP